MNASRAAVIVVGVNLIAVWAAAAAGSRTAVTEPAAPLQVAAGEAITDARASLLAAAERLEAHARRNAPAGTARDPFRFGAEARPAAARRSPGRAEPRVPDRPSQSVEPPAEPELDIVLQGMAESAEGETVVRTAILRAGGDLVLAPLGTRVGGRFEVVALTADSVELEDVSSRVRRVCRMK